MSKTYEALRRAHLEKRTSGKNLDIVDPRKLVLEEELQIGEEMLSLYKVIDAQFETMTNRVLQFIGSSPGEGASTVAREFARVTAERIGQRVLLIDADRHEGTQSKFYSMQSEDGWMQAIEEPDKQGNAIHRIGESRLFLSPASNSGSPTPRIFSGPRFDEFWSRIKLNFDLLVIDSPALAVSPDALAIASRVDGVVLVVEAEKTRWRTARYVKEQIERVGGNVLGTVFNKRRYYVPQCIYKHL